MRTFGLIGYPLKHSFSPGYFKNKFEKEGILNSEYRLFEITGIDELENLINNHMPLGLNVTIPYKQQVIAYLDELSPEAKKIGAVNTIKIVDGIAKGYNTDIFGFQESLTSLFGDVKPNAALVLGTGGAAQAVQYVLEELDIMYHNVSRRQGFVNYEDLDKALITKHQLIINTTPLGTYPNADNCPHIPYEFLSTDHILYDLVYNPAETLFMRKGKMKGAKVKNGLEMLHLQAEKAWEIWNEELPVF